MSTVNLIITDSGPNNITVRVESDPPYPFDGEDLQDDRLTKAQSAGILAADAIGAAAGQTDWLQLIRPAP